VGVVSGWAPGRVRDDTRRATVLLSRSVLWFALAIPLAGCGTDKPASVNDTAVVVSPAEPPPVLEPSPVSMHGWRTAEAGRLLIVPAGGSALRAQLVFPQFTDSTLTPSASFDIAAAEGMEVELFSTSGLVGRGTLDAPSPGIPAHSSRAGDSATAADASGCTAWPQARVVPSTEPMTPWTVAFAAGRAVSIPLDSITGLSSADSAQLAVQVARVASTLPQDPTSMFRGLPFVVRNARRFSPVAGVQAVVATVTRRVSQEANQRTEQLFLIAERASDRPRSSYVLAYSERVEGEEETMELNDVLAAVRLGQAGRPTLVVGRDYGDGNSFSLIERTNAGRWRVQWSSAYTGC